MRYFWKTVLINSPPVDMPLYPNHTQKQNKEAAIWYNLESSPCAGGCLELPGRAGARSFHKERQEQGRRVCQCRLTDYRMDSRREEGMVSWELRCKTWHGTGNKAVETENLGSSKMIIWVLSKLCIKNPQYTASKGYLYKQSRNFSNLLFKSDSSSLPFLFVFHSFSCRTQEKTEKVWKYSLPWLYFSCDVFAKVPVASALSSSF